MLAKKCQQCVTLTSDLPVSEHLTKRRGQAPTQRHVSFPGCWATVLSRVLLTGTCLDPWLCWPASLSWNHWVIPVSLWIMEQRTAHSHLIPAQTFPQTHSARASGKWERNRGMWHWWVLQDRLARGPPAPFLLRQECRLVNWLARIRPVQVLISARPQRSWSETALVKSGHVLNASDLCLFRTNGLDWSSVLLLNDIG